MALLILAINPIVYCFPLFFLVFSLLGNAYYLKFKPLEERVSKLEELLSKQEDTKND